MSKKNEFSAAFINFGTCYDYQIKIRLMSELQRAVHLKSGIWKEGHV